MIDLATYEPRGDKKNSSFFETNLPRVYERRSISGLHQLVGAMAAVVIQVDHGDALAYMAELALMGPYRFRECWLNESHRIYLRLREQLSPEGRSLADQWGGPQSREPGTVLALADGIGAVVATGGCPVLVRKGQLEGKAAIEGTALLQQLNLRGGESLG